MTISEVLLQRAAEKCELCNAKTNLSEYTVAPKAGDHPDHQVVICATCKNQIEQAEQIDTNHWRCLNESIWSPVPAVQVLAYRMLQQLNTEPWAQDLLNMIYLEESTLEWANTQHQDKQLVHKDSNGNILQTGDTVTLIQDLNVKGASFTAKRGTAVRKIRLDQDNADYIEGKIEGQQIAILTKYVKKT